MGSYDVAQICLNGHVVNDSYNRYPECNQKYCDECGAETIIKCLKCQTPIRGDYHVDGVIASPSYNPPKFCHECGEPYPWTAKALNAAIELAELTDNLTPEEQEQLKKTLDDLIKDGPQTVVATTRFKKIVSKTAPEIANGFKSILIEIVSESVKKAIWG
jgi:hypothetical protein